MPERDRERGRLGTQKGQTGITLGPHFPTFLITVPFYCESFSSTWLLPFPFTLPLITSTTSILLSWLYSLHCAYTTSNSSFFAKYDHHTITLCPHYLHLLILITSFTYCVLFHPNLLESVPLYPHSITLCSKLHIICIILHVNTLYCFFTSILILPFIPHSLTLPLIH